MREVLGDAMGHRAHGGEHRALGGLAHRLVGGVGGTRERGAHEDRVDQLSRPRRELLGGAAHDLRKDHAAVPARAEQRRAGDRRHELVAADLVDHVPVDVVELGEHGAHRHRHVVPGIAVGDGEDVEVVHLGAAAVELRACGGHRSAEAHDAGI